VSEPPPDREAADARTAHVQPGAATTKPRWATPLGIAVAVAVVVVIVVLHLTGAIGPGAH
jgi:negative regulator of sigma E activity